MSLFLDKRFFAFATLLFLASFFSDDFEAAVFFDTALLLVLRFTFNVFLRAGSPFSATFWPLLNFSFFFISTQLRTKEFVRMLAHLVKIVRKIFRDSFFSLCFQQDHSICHLEVCYFQTFQLALHECRVHNTGSKVFC